MKTERLEAVTLESFNVENAPEGEPKITTLKYKDVKYFRGKRLVRQDFYEVDNTLKGFEVITKTGDIGVSNYYSPDSNLLAIYHLTYSPNSELIVKKEGFDGQSKELLRVENFTYDLKTAAINSKTIHDASGQMVRGFVMTLDDKGNETEVKILNPDGNQVAKETYQIAKSDTEGKWLERWGKVNDVTKTFQRRTFTNSEN